MHGLLLLVLLLLLDGRHRALLDGMGWYWRVNDGRVSLGCRRDVQHAKIISSKGIAKRTMNGRL